MRENNGVKVIVHRTLVTIQNRGASIILQHSECSQPTSPRIYVCDNEGKKKKGKQLLTGIKTVDHDFISNNETVVRTLGIGSCALMPTRSTLSSKAAPNIPSREVTSLNWLIFFLFFLSKRGESSSLVRSSTSLSNALAALHCSACNVCR